MKQLKITEAIFISIFIFCVLFSSCTSYNYSANLYTYNCYFKSPIKFHIQKDNYEEWIVYFFCDSISECIIIFEGGLLELPPDSFKPDTTIITDNRISWRGKKEGSYWRKDKLNGISLYYYQISNKNKKKYDNLMDHIHLKIK